MSATARSLVAVVARRRDPRRRGARAGPARGQGPRNTALALGQIALFVAVGLAGASVAGQSGLVSLLLRSSPWFLIFFLLGFLLLACLWAAAGALANRQEDLQATTMPLQVLVFVPFFAAAYVYTPGTLLTTLSYIPFTAPIAMPRRLGLGDAAWWEGALAALVVAAAAVLLVAVATRIYERSLLQSAGRLGWTNTPRPGTRPAHLETPPPRSLT
jgi:ABC-2 type transport system permease protein